MSGLEIIGALSAVAGAVGAISQGNAQAAAAKQSAKAAEMQAKQELNVANANAGRIRDQGDIEAGQQVAGAAGSGLLLEGSLADVIAQNRAAKIHEAAGALYQGQAKANALRNEAAIFKAQAANARSSAMGGAALSLLKGGGSIDFDNLFSGIGGAGKTIAPDLTARNNEGGYW